MPAITLAAPAKLNLHLEIIRRREDGFHELESIFQTIDLHDRITVSTSTGNGIVMSSDDPNLPNDRTNLAWRAAEYFLETLPNPPAISIGLQKVIPSGAGLGGGSSDAAAVLRALSFLLPGYHTPQTLSRLASKIGSDIPFFLTGGTALGQGRGEEIYSLPDLPRKPVTLFMPTGFVSTPAAYQQLTNNERGPRLPHSTEWWQKNLIEQPIEQFLFNRLTAPAQRLCPAVTELLTWLQSLDVPYMMSGSGAACFALAHIQTPPPIGVRSWKTWFRTRADLNRTGPE